MKFDDRPEEAKRLELARKARGFKHAIDAARRYGWKYETYIQHEQGIRGLSRAAMAYASRFHVSLDWLLRGEGDGPTPRDADLAGRLSPSEIDEIDSEVRTIREALITRKLQDRA